MVSTVVVVDMVESVRHYEEDEEGTARRWHAFVGEVITVLLPRHHGRLVKSLGDGLLLTFGAIDPAVACALDMQSTMTRTHSALLPQRQVWFRCGVHAGEVIPGELDIQGRTVNLTARIASLGRPGDIVVSAAVRDQLTDGLDAEVDDLGECYLKHLSAPVRAYRIGAPHSAAQDDGAAAMPADLCPVLAVVPLSPRGDDGRLQIIGEVVVDEVINALSRTPELRVISRLSTSCLRGRADLLDAAHRHLGANYLLTGTCMLEGDHVRVHVEVVDTGRGGVLWAGTFSERSEAVCGPDSQLAREISIQTSVAVLAHELSMARSAALPNLGAYTMLLGGVLLMHRFSPKEFERSGAVLEGLTQRVPGHASPWAWLARWHDLRVFQGWSSDPREDAARALDLSHRALDIDPRSSIALTTAGAVHGILMRDLDRGIGLYRQAIEANPSEPLAWLLLGAAHAFRGEGAQAMQASSRAISLSPLDPLRFFYDALRASCAISAGEYALAIDLAQKSLRANRMHLSTHRVLAIAQCLGGDVVSARATVQGLLQLDPQFTVRRFLDRSPGATYPIAQVFAQALREAGVPPG